MFKADSLGFLDLEGRLEKFAPHYELDLMHVTAAPPWVRSMQDVEIALDLFWDTVPKIKHKARVIRNTRELEKLSVSPRKNLGLVLGLQCPPDDADVSKLMERGVRIITLAYDEKNTPFAGGFPNEDVGISPRGHEFLSECLKRKMIVDLSHASAQTVKEVIEVYQEIGLGPCVTHTACWDEYDHARNVSDLDMRAIAECGGYIGIAALTFILDKSDNSIEPFLTHIDRALQVCGEDVVGVGSDGPYYSPSSFKELEVQAEKLAVQLDGKRSFGSRFPHHPFDLYHPYKMGMIERRLAQRYKPRVVEKLIGGNFRGYLLENLPK